MYTATITNRGTARPQPRPSRTLFPASTNLASANASQGSCSGSPTVVCNLGRSTRRGGDRDDHGDDDPPGTVFDRGWVSDDPPGNWHHGHLVVTQVRDANPDLDLHLSGSPVERDRGPAGDLHRHDHESRLGNRRDGGVPGSDPGEDDARLRVREPGQLRWQPDRPLQPRRARPNASATVTVVVATTQPGPIVDRGWVSTSPPGGWQHERDVTTNVRGAERRPRPAPVRAPPAVNAGEQVVYTATIENHGPAAVASAAFQDQLPGKVTLVSASAGQGSCSGNPTIVCNLGPLAANASATVTITVTTTDGGTIVDRAWVSANPPGNWHHERDVATSVRSVSPDLDFHLVGSPTGVNAGQQITYTAIIGNHGTGPANAAFQDVLPGKATLVSATAGTGSCTGSPTVVCTLGTLAPGATATVTITVTATQAGPLVNRGWVSDNPPGNWEHERDVVTSVH